MVAHVEIMENNRIAKKVYDDEFMGSHPGNSQEKVY